MVATANDIFSLPPEFLRKGRFELAEGGTFFLDEIGDMDSVLRALRL